MALPAGADQGALAADGCGAPVGGVALDGVDLEKEAVIQGVVARGVGDDAEPVSNAYVRLLDRRGEFAAEVQTADEGRFRFFAAPGPWTLRVLAPSAEPVDRPVTGGRGTITEVTIQLT